jgi:peptidoglycan/xylan/chitin deacetylase (PgdA/CDA1 family)
MLAAVLVGPLAAQRAAPPSSFRWPEGKRAAISLTFDDARTSQVDVGLPVLNRCGVKATFYLVPGNAQKRAEGWKKAYADGHEIAHHSATHPCTGNYRFSRDNALEEYTLDRMAADLDRATSELQALVGTKPMSFAYPCGQKFVGRGKQTRSYVPLIAERFLTGRGYLDESANDPAVCDLANLMGTAFDGISFEEMRKLATATAEERRWVIFVGHDVGTAAHQTTGTEALEQLCRFAKDPANGLWIDTVANIAGYVAKQR